MSGQSIHAEKQHHIDMKAGDIAPTVLHLLGLAIPEEMTAQNLIVK